MLRIRRLASLSLLGFAVMLGAGRAVAGPAGGPVTTTGETTVSARGAVLGPGSLTAAAAVSANTRVVGVQWSGDTTAEVEIQARDADGGWSAVGVVSRPDGGADPGSADARRARRVLGTRTASEPVVVESPSAIRLRVTAGTPQDLRIVAVATSDGARERGSTEVLPLAAPGALGLLGLIRWRGRRPGPRALVGVLVVSLAGAFVVDSRGAGAAAPGDVPPPPQPGIVTRAQWGADESLRLNACPDGPDYAPRDVLAVVHHTDTPNGYSQAQAPAIVRSIYTYFVIGRGYCDTGYNFLVDRFGTIYEGRYGGIDATVVGAHATGFNYGTIGISMIGDHTTLSPSPATFSALTSLVAWKFTVHQVNPFAPVPTHGTLVDPIIGHRDAGALSNDPTSCPGNAGYAILPLLRTIVRPQVAYGYPWGRVDELRREPAAVHVRGWAVDPDTPDPIQVHVYVDGVGTAIVTAGLARPDIGARWPWLGANHGFDASIGIAPGRHHVCVYAVSVGNGGNRTLACAVLDNAITGAVDLVRREGGPLHVAGWLLDPDRSDPIALHVYVDGIGAAVVTASTNRPDVGAAYPGYGPNHGYDTTIAVAGTRRVCLYGVAPGKQSRTLTCTGTSGVPVGALDGASRGPGGLRVRGWTLDPDTAAPIAVHVYVDGRGYSLGPAFASRPDVGAAFPGYGAGHGYDTVLPDPGPGTHTVCAYGISVLGDANALLGCRAT